MMEIDEISCIINKIYPNTELNKIQTKRLCFVVLGRYGDTELAGLTNTYFTARKNVPYDPSPFIMESKSDHRAVWEFNM